MESNRGLINVTSRATFFPVLREGHCANRETRFDNFLSNSCSILFTSLHRRNVSITYTISCMVDYTRNKRDSDSLRHDQLPARSLITRAPLIFLLSYRHYCASTVNVHDRSWKPLDRHQALHITHARPWSTRIEPSMLHFESLLFHVVEQSTTTTTTFHHFLHRGNKRFRRSI